MSNLPQAVTPTGAATDLGSSVRLALAGLATVVATNGAHYLVAHGYIDSAQVADAITWGSALILAGVAAVWSKLRNIHIGNSLVAAAATGNPSADPKKPDVQEAVARAIASNSSPIVAKS